jgi:putative intracellular protease/amidase
VSEHGYWGRSASNRWPRSTSRVEAADYDAVLFPGGHGTVWDVNQDRPRRVLRSALAGDSEKALVVCHAVGILAWVRDEDGNFVVDGREVTGFPNAREAGIVDDGSRMPDGRKLPYRVEEEVVAAGGDWDAELDSDTRVTVDGDS